LICWPQAGQTNLNSFMLLKIGFHIRVTLATGFSPCPNLDFPPEFQSWNEKKWDSISSTTVLLTSEQQPPQLSGFGYLGPGISALNVPTTQLFISSGMQR
jgi:hypothetical protein